MWACPPAHQAHPGTCVTAAAHRLLSGSATHLRFGAQAGGAGGGSRGPAVGGPAAAQHGAGGRVVRRPRPPFQPGAPQTNSSYRQHIGISPIFSQTHGSMLMQKNAMKAGARRASTRSARMNVRAQAAAVAEQKTLVTKRSEEVGGQLRALGLPGDGACDARDHRVASLSCHVTYPGGPARARTLVGRAHGAGGLPCPLIAPRASQRWSLALQSSMHRFRQPRWQAGPTALELDAMHGSDRSRRPAPPHPRRSSLRPRTCCPVA